MARSITVGGVALPVTDASMSTSREPIMEQSMNGKGGQILYGGLYSAPQGSFSGVYRPNMFAEYITNLLTEGTPDSYAVVVYDDNGKSLTSATTYITGCEISMKVGELAKISFNFVGQAMEYTTGSPATTAVFTETVPVFYKSSTSWGECSEFTMKIERPYTADDYVLSTSSDFFSHSIYQSGDTKVTGTVKLSQTASYKSADFGVTSLVMTLGRDPTGTTIITIPGAVLSNAEMGISGRGLISKTQAWAAPSGKTGALITITTT